MSWGGLIVCSETCFRPTLSLLTSSLWISGEGQVSWGHLCGLGTITQWILIWTSYWRAYFPCTPNCCHAEDIPTNVLLLLWTEGLTLLWMSYYSYTERGWLYCWIGYCYWYIERGWLYCWLGYELTRTEVLTLC